MQATHYAEAIPVDQLKVGDIILRSREREALTYISSIKACSSAQGTYNYFRVNIKRLGSGTKDRVYADFTSFTQRSPAINHVVGFGNKVTIIRPADAKELDAVGAYWKYITKAISNADSLYQVWATVWHTNATNCYYDIFSFMEALGSSSSQSLVETIEDRITAAIQDTEQGVLTEELCLESVDLYKEFTLYHARDVAKLILNGEGFLAIRNRVAAWKLAYTEKAEAAVRMQQAFDLSK